MASTAQEALFENEPVGQIKSTTPAVLCPQEERTRRHDADIGRELDVRYPSTPWLIDDPS